jgi:DsbC/DsbD-like thiol-disulfide interchange protein
MSPVVRFVVLGLLCMGQASIFADEHTERKPLVEVLPIQSVKLQPGESSHVGISILIAEGFKVQANPAASEFLIPLELRITGTEKVVFGTPVYPPPSLHRLKGGVQDLTIYEGSVEITLPVSVDEATMTGEISLPADLRFQACDARRCYAPDTVPLVIKIVVAG